MTSTTTKNRIIYISQARANEEDQSWTPETIYGIQGAGEGRSKFFWSSDGIGRNFFETLAELKEEIGI
jgi:hypothetical protein